MDAAASRGPFPPPPEYRSSILLLILSIPPVLLFLLRATLFPFLPSRFSSLFSYISLFLVSLVHRCRRREFHFLTWTRFLDRDWLHTHIHALSYIYIYIHMYCIRHWYSVSSSHRITFLFRDFFGGGGRKEGRKEGEGWLVAADRSPFPE